MKKWISILINPFEDFKSNVLLFVGITAYIWASVQAFLFGYVTDGVFQAHLANDVQWYSGFVNGGINVGSVTLLLWILGRNAYKKVRIIDVLNVSLIAQIPNYLSALILMNPLAKRSLNNIAEAIESGDMFLKNVSTRDTVVISVGGLIVLGMLLYFFYLLVVGMKIAINSKKAIHTILIILLTILLDTILHYLNPYV